MGRTLLVIECQGNLNWYDIFKGATLNGEPITVEQAEWDDISVVSYHDSGVVVKMRASKKPLPGTTQDKERTIVIHCVLLRSVTRGIKGQDSRNKLFALIHGNIPAVNSLQSAYICLERPLVFGALKNIQKKLGKDNFPLIDQTFYSSYLDMLITPSFPLVAKVGHAHAGYGKMRFMDNQEFADFRGLIALHGDYVTAEPFVEWDWDGRIQKIGCHYRGFRRMSPNWKGNVGNMSIIEDLEVTEKYKTWIDECAKLLGGLDICALDFLHSKSDGKEYILELNDTAIGLVHKYEQEDMGFIRDIVMVRMAEAYPPKDDKGKTKETISEDLTSLKSEIEQLKAQLKREKEEHETIKHKLEEKKKKKKGLFSK